MHTYAINQLEEHAMASPQLEVQGESLLIFAAEAATDDDLHESTADFRVNIFDKSEEEDEYEDDEEDEDEFEVD